MKRFIGRQDGQTFVLVIIIATVLFVTSSALGVMACKSYINMAREEKFIQVYYAAEAGIEKTIAAIKADVSWSGNIPNTADDVFTLVFPETEINNGITNTVAVSKQKQHIGDLLSVKSLGKCKAGDGGLLAQKTLQCKIAVYKAPDYFKGLEVLPAQPVPFDFDGMKLTGGNLVVNGSINLSESMQVDGDILASDDVKGNNGINDSTQIYESYDYIPPFPDLDEGYYLKRATEAKQDFDTDVNFGNDIWSVEELGEILQDVTNYSGFYYVDGDVTITGDYSGRALIFATGNIEVVGNMMPVNTLVSADSLTLISLKDVDINNYEVYTNIMAKGSLVVRHGAKLHGAACVGVNLVNGAPETDDTFEFEVCDVTSMEPLEGAIDAQINKILWEELYPVF